MLKQTMLEDLVEYSDKKIFENQALLNKWKREKYKTRESKKW